MQVTPKITFHNVDSSAAIEKRIREKIAKLEERFSGIIGCHVVVDAAHHHQHKGVLYSVRIDVTLPNKELLVSHHPGKSVPRHEKVYAAMNDAFLAMEKQLLQYKELRNRDVKQHSQSLLKGRVIRIDEEKGFGFIETADKSEVYFHQNAVQIGRFSDLKLGSIVRYSFAEGEGLKGPQAKRGKGVKSFVVCCRAIFERGHESLCQSSD